MDLQALPAAILTYERADSPDAGIVRVDLQAAAGASTPAIDRRRLPPWMAHGPARIA
ncbi:MAG: hypothetical protein IPK80_30680 [Nannocystis sp.]|nr:hypothetical protein [Nannocystis sp.]